MDHFEKRIKKLKKWKKLKDRDIVIYQGHNVQEKYMKNKIQFKHELKELAIYLNQNTPSSELWFRSHWPRKNGERYNRVIEGRYIADVCNEAYKYIIEIDGGAHDDAHQAKKDYYKTKFLQRTGFKVYRIKYKDLQTLEEVKQEVEDYIDANPQMWEEYQEAIKPKYTFIDTKKKKYK